MTMRTIAFLIMGLMLGGCMQETLEPSTQVAWKPRDKELMANLPYAQASIPEPYRRHIVDFDRKEAPGSIVVDSDNKFLFYVLPNHQAIRYGIAVGEDAPGVERHRQGRTHGRMAGLDADTRRAAAARPAAGFRHRRTA